MNRRDNVTKHHSGGGAMLTTINHYKSRGMTPSMMTVGFPMYAKYFEAGKGAPCTVDNPVGCEFPEFTFENKMGKDTGKSGVYIMNEQFMTPLYLGNAFAAVEQKVKTSWATAQTNAKHDAEGMATSAWDADNGIYWTWLTDKDVEASCEAVMKEVGGVMVWSVPVCCAVGPRLSGHNTDHAGQSIRTSVPLPADPASMPCRGVLEMFNGCASCLSDSARSTVHVSGCMCHATRR
jgi:hypothetical protein